MPGKRTMDRRTFVGALGAAPVLSTVRAQTARRYKACIIGDSAAGGYGHWLHVALAHRPDVAVAALADPDPEGRAKHAAEAGAERTYADYREMLAKEQPDLTVVGPRWSVRHKEYVLAAAEAGAHGLLEKPIAPSLAEADAMIEAVRAKDLKWSIMHNFRASPVIAHVKRVLAEQRLIGNVLEARGRGKEDARAGGEDLIVLGTHTFDMMLHFMGPAGWCQADITTNGNPSTPADVHEAGEPLGPVVGNRLHAMYGFQMGTAGHFSSMMNRHGNGGRWGLDIYGSQGAVSIRMDVVPEVGLLRDPSWAPGHGAAAWEPFPDVPEVTMEDERNGRNAPIVDDLIDAIETGREPAFSLETGRAAYEMIQGVFEAYVQGCRVSLPLANREHPLEEWAKQSGSET